MTNTLILEIETSPEMIQAIQEFFSLEYSGKVDKFYEITPAGNTFVNTIADNDVSKLNLLTLIKSLKTNVSNTVQNG